MPRTRGATKAKARRLPRDVHPDSLSRLPLLRREDLDAQSQRLYDAAVGPQSRTLVGLQGPSGIWLHSPILGEHLRAANQYLRFETDLGRRLTELAILVTARELDSQFEWTAHEPVALRDGLDQAIIDVVKYRQPLSGLPANEALIIRFGRELFGRKKVRSETFARAVQVFGWRGVVNLAAVMANYAMTAVMFNAVDQHLRPDQRPLLPSG
jgi:4-carboxymuconolactone decarboxylase